MAEAASLPVKVSQVSLLHKILHDAKSWLQAAATFLPGIGVKGSCTEEQLEQLISDAKVMCFDAVPVLDYLLFFLTI